VSSRLRYGLGSLLAAFLLGSTPGCSTTHPPPHPRPALPLPGEVQAAFALREPVAVQTISCTGGDRYRLAWEGMLTCENEVARFHVLCPRASVPPPLVLCLPILAGGTDLMRTVASGVVARGYAAAWVERVGPALRDGQRGEALETLFRRTLVHNRMLLRWAERRGDLFAPGKRALLGISTGGIVGTVLLALEPSLGAGAICLSGGDLPSLLLETAEPRVARWRSERASEDGLGGRYLQRELERELTLDPARFGAYVATERVVLVHAGLDDVIPQAHHALLWESLGRPRDLCLPWLGHYSAILALDAILDAVTDFYRARFDAPA